MGVANRVFVDSIDHAGEGGLGEEGLREARAAGRAFAIAPGKRAEFRVAPGARAVVYVLEGSVRFEGDDTPAIAGDTVRFRPAPGGEPSLLGLQADAPARGIVMGGAPGLS